MVESVLNASCCFILLLLTIYSTYIFSHFRAWIRVNKLFSIQLGKKLKRDNTRALFRRINRDIRVQTDKKEIAKTLSQFKKSCKKTGGGKGDDPPPQDDPDNIMIEDDGQSFEPYYAPGTSVEIATDSGIGTLGEDTEGADIEGQEKDNFGGEGIEGKDKDGIGSNLTIGREEEHMYASIMKKHAPKKRRKKNVNVEENVSAMEKYYNLCYKKQKKNEKLERQNLKLKNWHLRNKIKLDEIKAIKLGSNLSPYIDSSSDSSEGLTSDSE